MMIAPTWLQIIGLILIANGTSIATWLVWAIYDDHKHSKIILQQPPLETFNFPTSPTQTISLTDNQGNLWHFTVGVGQPKIEKSKHK